jgi:biopolymer transport protein ExbB/TolQ
MLGTISFICYALIAVVFVWGLRDIKNKKNANLQAGLSAGLGMLGTFIGISLGLDGFDENNITASIPILLDGMKTAFWTSVWGMISNISLKAISNIFRHKDDPKTGENDAETVISLLKDMVKNGQENSGLMKNIEKSISGDGDSTLLTNIIRLRTNIQDNLSELNKSFKDFAQKQAENNTKALMEAIERVIGDFNTKINEQLGDNFKKFNEALSIMLEWQKNYKEQVEKITEQFDLAATGINECRIMVREIAKSQSIFQKTADALADCLENLNTDLAGMAGIADKATNAFPIIHDNIENLTKRFAAEVENSTKRINEMLEGQIDGMNQQKQIFIKSYQEFEQNSIKIATDANQRITERITNLDEALGEELKKALEQMGKALVQITNRFAKDYEIITNSIVQYQEAIKRNQ